MTRFDPVLLELGEKGGDGERLVFYKYKSRLQRFFQAKGISPEEARDLTQETFLRLFRAEAKVESRESLESWLFEIARNVLAKSLRARNALKRNPKGTGSLDEIDPEEVLSELAESANPLDEVIAKEKLEYLRRAIDELPEQMRQCVRLRLRGLKIEEIAQVFKISPETVRSHLYQARRRLWVTIGQTFDAIDF